MYADYLSQARKAISLSEFRQIHKKAQQAVDELKSKEAEVIRALQTVDQYKVYRFLGLNSVFQYALSLGLSESQAYAYITVGRKAREFPGLQRAIEEKEITVSKAKTIASVINDKNQTTWLSLAKTSSKRDLEREVARVNPKAVKKESSRFVNDHMLELQVTIEEDTFKLLERVKELMAQKTCRPVSLEEALKLLASGYIKKEDPVERAKRILSKKEKTHKPTQLVPGRVGVDNSRKLRKPLPARLKHLVHLRDQGKCQFEKFRHKDLRAHTCNERKWIEIHHVKPLSEGGKDSLDNLISLCNSHHKMIHEIHE